MDCHLAYYIAGCLSIYFIKIPVNIYFNAFIRVRVKFLLDS